MTSGPQVVRQSVFGAFVLAVVARFRAAFDNVTDATASLAETSILAGIAGTLARWSRHSTTYRWCIEEPNTTVITIDLRETVAIGPFLLVFDHLLATARTTWHASRTRRAVAPIRRTVEHARSVQFLVAVLRPPSRLDDEQ